MTQAVAAAAATAVPGGQPAVAACGSAMLRVAAAGQALACTRVWVCGGGGEAYDHPRVRGVGEQTHLTRDSDLTRSKRRLANRSNVSKVVKFKKRRIRTVPPTSLRTHPSPLTSQ